MSLSGLPTNSASSDTPSQPRPARRNVRFTPDPNTPPIQFTDVAGQKLSAVLTNESFSGIAAIVADAVGLEVGQLTAVDYFGYPMPGVIRRVIAQTDGTWLIGVEWK